MWFFAFFMIWGVPLGSLWASFSLLFVKILIFLKKVVPPILNDSTVFLLHFGGPGPPGRHQKVKKHEKTGLGILLEFCSEKKECRSWFL